MHWVLKNAKGAKRDALPTHESTDTHKTAAMKALAFKDIAAGRAKDIIYPYLYHIKSN